MLHVQRDHLLAGFAAVLIVFFLASPAHAQNGIAFGYQGQNLWIGDGGRNYPAGIGGDYTRRVSGSLALIAAGDWSHRSDPVFSSLTSGVPIAQVGSVVHNVVTFGAGVRYVKWTRGFVAPFLEATGGVTRAAVRLEDSGSLVVPTRAPIRPMLQPSAGAIFSFNQTWGVVASVAYRHVFTTPETSHYLRTLVGVQTHF